MLEARGGKVKFKGTELHHMTFSTSAVRGYKKQDVDDFLVHVAKDYKDFELRLEELRSEISELEEEKEQLEERIETFKQEKRKLSSAHQEELHALRQELIHSGKPSAGTSQDSNSQELLVAQNIALSLEKEAKEQASMKIEEADRYYASQVANARQFKEDLFSDLEKNQRLLTQSKEEILYSLERTTESFLNIYEKLASRYEEYGNSVQ